MSADLQSIFRRTDLFQRAVGPGVSVLRVVARMSLDGGIWKRGGYRKQRSSQAFCTHLDFPCFSFFLSFFPFLHIISSLILHTSISHTIFLETPHVLRVTPFFKVD